MIKTVQGKGVLRKIPNTLREVDSRKESLEQHM
jgi:hypothetical protein